MAATHELVISHGNGPQIGLLALEGAAYEPVPVYPLDVLGAETQGMVGYLIEQELGNRLPFERPLATLLTMIEVDPDDPAFADPSKPIGPLYTADGGGRARARAGLDLPARRRPRPSGGAVTGPEAHLRAPPDLRGCSTPAAWSSAPAGAASPPRTTTSGSSTASRPSSTRTTPAACCPATSTPTCS